MQCPILIIKTKERKSWYHKRAPLALKNPRRMHKVQTVVIRFVSLLVLPTKMLLRILLACLEYACQYPDISLYAAEPAR